MKTKFFFSGILALALVFGFIGCAEGEGEGGGKSDPKTLVITGIPAEVYQYGASGGQIGVFPAGTTLEQASAQTGIVAGASLQQQDVTLAQSGSTYTGTFPLYDVSSSNRWTGSGKFTVYAQIGDHYYKMDSVSFSSGTTTVSWSSVTPVNP